MVLRKFSLRAKSISWIILTKLSAAIDKDNDRFLAAMKVLDFAFKGNWFALSFATPEVSAVANPQLLAIEAPHKTLEKYVTKKVMSNRVKNNTHSSLGLLNYRSDKMLVELFRLAQSTLNSTLANN